MQIKHIVMPYVKYVFFFFFILTSQSYIAHINRAYHHHKNNPIKISTIKTKTNMHISWYELIDIHSAYVSMLLFEKHKLPII